MTVARVTQVAVEVLASYTPKAVVTQAAVEVLASYTPMLRSTSQVVQVLYTESTGNRRRRFLIGAA